MHEKRNFKTAQPIIRITSDTIYRKFAVFYKILDGLGI